MPDGRKPVDGASGARSLEQPRDPLLAELYCLWQAKRRDGNLPARADFDPSEFRRLLPNILLLDVLPPPDVYRVRLAGQAVNEFYGRSIAGLTPRDYMASDAALGVSALVGSIVATGRPVFRSGQTYWRSEETYKTYENCMLPLAKDGKTVDMLLVAIRFGD